MKQLLAAIVFGLFISVTPASAEPVLILDQEYLIGSGTVIASFNGVSTILTARHVCQGNTVPGVMVEGKEPIPAAVISMHIKEDICLMMAVGKFEVTKVAKEFDPKIDYARVYSLFPGPIAGMKFPITLLESIYDPEFGHFMAFNGICYPGMSGSPVINSKGELIGVIIIGTTDSLHGGYVELPYIHQLLSGVDSAVVNVYRTQAIN